MMHHQAHPSGNFPLHKMAQASPPPAVSVVPVSGAAVSDILKPGVPTAVSVLGNPTDLPTATIAPAPGGVLSSPQGVVLSSPREEPPGGVLLSPQKDADDADFDDTDSDDADSDDTE